MGKNARRIKLAIDDVEMEQIVEGEHADVELTINARGSRIELRVESTRAESASESRVGKKAEARSEPLEGGESIEFKNGGAEIELTPVKARGEERTPITRENLEGIWSEYKKRKYTHLRLIVNGERYDLFGDIGHGHTIFSIAGKDALKLAKALGLEWKLTPSGFLRFGRDYLAELLDKGVEAYAVRKAKKGEAMWLVKIIYKNKIIELKMSYHNYCLTKRSNKGAINVVVHEASGRGKAQLDLGLLADMKMGALDCAGCLEGWLAEALNAAGVEWRATPERFFMRLPGDLKTAIRQFYSK